jgi:eukaryotic-like serine/threonine-protein kinase
VTADSSFDSTSAAPEAARHVDDVCTRFERAWKRGDRPRIEDFLDVAEEAERPVLLRELIALEVELRLRRGEDPKPSEYRDRFPEQTGVVDAALTATVLGPESNQPRRRPTRDDTNRNLLLGLLALQNGLIDQDQLVAAFGAWARANGKTLAEILFERGSIDAESRSLLAALADEQLGLHAGDAERTRATRSGPATTSAF